MSTLLIVDDDAETVRFMEELLAEPGRQILSAGTPDRALALVREHEVDVVVSDIHLNADRSGLDLLRAVRSGGHPARVVLISGFGTLETAIDAVRARRVRLRQQAVRHRRSEGHRRAGVDGLGAAAPRRPRPSRPPPGLIGRIAGDARRLQADRARRRRAGARADRRRERHRQGAGRARHPPPRPPRGQAVRAGQLRRVRPRRCSSRSCSATRAARSPAPSTTRGDSSSRRRAARFSSTRSARRRPRCR